MLKGDSNDNGIEINRSNQQKNKICMCSTFLAIVLYDYYAVLHNIILMAREIVIHVFTHPKFCCLCSCSLLFFHYRSFSLCWPSRISHFLTTTARVSYFSSNEIGLLCFESLALALSLLSM